MHKIIWLASYPKSGNTWFRIFLSNLFEDSPEPVNINELLKTPIASSRDIFDEAVGLASSDLNVSEIERLRPRVYEYISDKTDEIIYMKIHDACTRVDPDRILVSHHATRCAVYIVRNPLDVAVSYANHSGIPIETSVGRLNDKDCCFQSKTDRIHFQLRQRLLTWSDHVRSWTEAPGFDVHVMRFEDMKRAPEKVFGEAVAFCGYNAGREAIHKAVRFSDFKEVKRQESEHGFKEKPDNCPCFFRKGQIGDWKKTLTDEQVREVVESHRDIMERYGYVDAQGYPL